MKLTPELLIKSTEGYAVFTGCEGSGLQSIAYALNGIGKDIGYKDVAGKDGVASDRVAPYFFGDAKVFHFVRHPLDHISWMMSGETDWRDFWIQGKTVLSRCMMYWQSWNSLVGQKADHVIRVEDIKEGWEIIASELGLNKPMPLVLADLTYGRVVSWADLEEDNEDLCDEVRGLALEYGYEVQDG